MHKSLDSFFSKILEKPSIVQKKNDASFKWAAFFHWDEAKKKRKKNQNGRLKNPHFPAPPILNIFLWKFYGLVLELVELIDAKGIDVAKPIWLWGCPT